MYLSLAAEVCRGALKWVDVSNILPVALCLNHEPRLGQHPALLLLGPERAVHRFLMASSVLEDDAMYLTIALYALLVDLFPPTLSAGRIMTVLPV